MTNDHIEELILGPTWYNHPFVAGPTECNA